MSNFVHLHCHSEYSLLDGAIRLDALCARTKEFGMPAAAVTDHGNLFAATHFYSTCKEYGIKPIIGCEVYVTKDHTDKLSKFSKARHHLILLARNKEGYHNLVKLVTRGYLDGFHYKPRVDKTLLKQFSNGITALSACLAGELPRTIMGKNIFVEKGGTFDDAISIAQEYASIYPGQFYLEVQANMLPEQQKVNEKLYELAEYTNLPLVATNDCHYLDADDVEAHDILLCVQTQAKFNDTDRMRFNATDLYYKSSEEMEKAFSHLPIAIENTIKIAESCSVEMDFSKNLFPVYELPKGVTPDDEFRRLAREGLQKRLEVYPNKEQLNTENYWERLEQELDIICKMGFPGYFLIVQDFINWAKDNNIPVGPGRGSATGSLVAWALRITNIDPLPYNLLFERFLNIERISLPDIDVDFCEDKRGDVIRYVMNKYGVNSVAQITTFGKMKAKAVVRDIGRVLDMSFKETDNIAKLIPDDLHMTILKAMEVEPKLQALYNEEPHIKRLLDISMKLEGLVRHASTHAAGVVVSDKPMDEYLPLYRGKKGELVTQFDMKMVEKVGLVKFDFLGLRTMTLIHTTLKTIEDQGKTPPNLDTLPLDDPKTYELLSRGDTDGVFQVESSGMRQYLRMLKPNCFEDLIAMLALYRPGPLGSGMVDEFIKRKHGTVTIEYPLPSLKDCLKDTYGVIVYQEQVMQIAQIVAGYSLGEADLLRRAMGKKNPVAMAKERTRFVEGAIKNNVTESVASDIFDLMEKFAEYGFNKSHSAVYALISYHTAYLKAHFTLEFMAALLTSESGNQNKILKYTAACKDMGIDILKPDIQTSRREFIVKDNSIVFGLCAIKNVGDDAIGKILTTREKDGPFLSLLDMSFRVNLKKVTRRVLESLVKGGACDSFGCSRAGMLTALDKIIARTYKKIKDEQSNQGSLLAFAPKIESVSLPGIGFVCEEQNMPEWDEDEKLLYEKEALGFFLTSHPLQTYRQEIYRLGLQPLEEVREMNDKTIIKSAIIVNNIREILNKRGNRMAFVRVEDLTASAEVTFFSEELQKSRELLSSNQPLLLTATIDSRESTQHDTVDESDETQLRSIKLRAISVESLVSACQNSELPISYYIDKNRLTTSGIEELKAILDKHKGKTEVHLIFSLDNINCQVRLGSSWNVSPSPAFQQDMYRWSIASE